MGEVIHVPVEMLAEDDGLRIWRQERDGKVVAYVVEVVGYQWEIGSALTPEVRGTVVQFRRVL